MKKFYLFLLTAMVGIVSAFALQNVAAEPMSNDEAAETFQSEYESLQKQFTQVYNTTVNCADYQTEMYASVIEEQTPILNAIQQNMGTLETWANESYEGGTLADDLEEILGQFESIQVQLTQFLNTFKDAIAEVEEVPVEVTLIADESVSYLLNSHSNVTVDMPVSAIEVAGLDASL